VIALAARIGGRLLPLGTVAVLLALLAAPAPSYAAPSEAPHLASTPSRQLSATIDSISPTIRSTRQLRLTGRLINPGHVDWLDAQVYLEVSSEPARTLTDLNRLAATADQDGFGTTIYKIGLFDVVGDIGPGQIRPYRLKVPFSALPISGDAGVYRVGIRVFAGTSAGRDDDAAHASTLVPLLPISRSAIVPVQTVTLLPLTAPVKRLGDGPFADDSLADSLSFHGRLYNVLAWALKAPPDSVQVVVDPALLSAVSAMSHGYRVRSSQPGHKTVPGHGQAAAATWLLNFDSLVDQQHVLLMPWGSPAANSLLTNRLPGPVEAAVSASKAYLTANPFGTAVTGWLPDGSSGQKALTVLHHAGASLQIIAQSSLPGLASEHPAPRFLPSLVDVSLRRQRVPVLVTSTDLAGTPTTRTTSALQFRQRLISDAAVRSLEGDTHQIRVTALPFRWNPGVIGAEQGLGDAFALPVLVSQSAIGAADQPARLYRGSVRPTPSPHPGLSALVVAAIRTLHVQGGDLSAILVPASAHSAFEHTLAMAGSNEWRAFPRVGAELIAQQAALAHAQLAKVTVTGPPFVAMSSASGRFPLTITNGLSQAIVVRLDVAPEDPALAIGQLQTIQLPAGDRRDIQVVATATGSGVTSVHARLETATQRPFGHAWRFDVRATQIGLVIWVVMAIGGAVLFGAAGYRIVQRLRGHGPARGAAR
jgi:hypothetical protein